MYVNEYGASFSRCLKPGSLIFPEGLNRFAVWELRSQD